MNQVIGFMAARDWRGVPQWLGESLRGKRILLHGSEIPGDPMGMGTGKGDSMYFARWIPLLARQGAIVAIAAHADCRRTLLQVEGVSSAIDDDNWDTFKPDVQCHLVFVPAFAYKLLTGERPMAPRKVEQFSSTQVPTRYLRASKPLELQGKHRIGLCWAGDPSHRVDPWRSILLKCLAPLGKIPNATFYSLQKGPGAAELRHAPFPIVDLMDQVQDFDDAAGIIAGLDMVVTCDTSMKYLATGMGARTIALTNVRARWGLVDATFPTLQEVTNDIDVVAQPKMREKSWTTTALRAALAIAQSLGEQLRPY